MQRYRRVIIVVVLLGGCAPARRDGIKPQADLGPPGESRATHDLLDLLNEQADSWNRGDLEGFMSYYWRSEDLIFISGDRVYRGWEATLNRYKKRYPTKEDMGWLRFSDLQVKSKGSNEAEVTGRWRVRADRKVSSGGFVLKFRKFKRRWLIVRDKTTSDSS